MSDYTPSLMDGQSYYVTGRAQIQRQITGEHAQDITPYSAEFDRMIEAVRAEAILSARDEIMPPVNCELRPDGTEDPESAEYVAAMNEVHDRLTEQAHRIEREAGL